MEEQAKTIARMLKVLANENRLLILCRLLDGPRTVGKIAEAVPGITQSALSQHLALLRAHGMLDSSKSGQKIIYKIADERVEKVIDLLREYYCQEGEGL
jgi:DNA-binding transcriptional ArsR family regulator